MVATPKDEASSPGQANLTTSCRRLEHYLKSGLLEWHGVKVWVVGVLQASNEEGSSLEVARLPSPRNMR